MKQHVNIGNIERRMRTITTPENLPLDLEIAQVGSRVSAFGIDFLLMVAASISLFIVGYIAVPGDGGAVRNLLRTVFLLGFFLIWNGYFVFFELFWRGATPGKRAVGLKVVSRNGGPLTTGAIFSRNLMRELEFYLPIKVLMFPGLMFVAVPTWATYLACLWLFLFLFFPFLNRDRARCGDLVAGTLVVVLPRSRLLTDPAESRKDQESASEYMFTNAQLDMYGIKELQVLEEILRFDIYNRNRRELLRMVCEKITKKIAWKEPVPEKEIIAFLKAFYKAQRFRLEERLLMGERRKHKREGKLE